MKPAIICQPHGLGDHIFTQTLVREISGGAKIIWPVNEIFMEGLQEAYPHISFVPDTIIKPEILETKSKQQDSPAGTIFGIRYAEWLMGRQYRDHMKSKYDLYGLDWRIWKRDAMPKRNLKKEKFLQHEVLHIKEGEPYNLIATKFGGAKEKEIQINLTNGVRNVNMTVIPEFSLFDWSGIIENATIIHAVSSSTLYLFELLDLKASQVHLYPRKPIENDFSFTRFLMTRNYILHD